MNVIIDKQGRLNLIDFASCLIAPWFYEMPGWDESYLMEAYYGDYMNEDFYEILIMDTLICHYSPWHSIYHLAKEVNIGVADITSVDMLKNMIIKQIEG